MNENPSPDAILQEVIRITDLEERAAYLEQACGEDGALRQQVESLLAAQFAAEAFLDPTVAQEAESPRDQEGDWIGRYKLLQRIGEGGMGDVWMAQQEKPVARKVALKIIKVGMDTSEVVTRFEAERQALALMDHPCIAHVFDGGASESGRPYFVMELVPGVPITQYCDDAKLNTRARLALFRQVCEAVGHAHQKGVIHRDLKPSNILVTNKDGHALPKIIDFGIAKAVSQPLTDRTLFTRFGQMLGTPAYMSPEQAQFSAEDVDTRSDIYSLGVLLYELLTGSTPFEDRELRKAAVHEMCRMIREEDPPKPSTRLSTLGEQLATVAAHQGTEPGRLGRTVRGELDWIVMKALEKDRTRRYETANAFALDLEHYASGEPISAAPPSFAYRAGKVIRKHWRAASVTGAFVLLLISGTIVSAMQATRASDAESKSRTDAALSKRLAASEKAARLEKERQLHVATAMRLAAQSQSIRRDTPTKSLLLAVEAVEATRRHHEPVMPIANENLRSALSMVGGFTLPGHKRGVTATAMSSDGHWLVTADDEVARLWDLTDPKPWASPVLLRGHAGAVISAALSSNARWAVTGGEDGAVRLWDLQRQAFGDPFVLRGGGAPVRTVAFSPSGHWLAARYGDCSLRIWNLSVDDPTSTGVELAADRELDGSTDIIITKDGQWTVGRRIGGGSGDVRLWDLRKADSEAPVLIQAQPTTVSSLRRVRFSPNCRWVVSVLDLSDSRDREVHLWDLTAADLADTVKIFRGSKVSNWSSEIEFSMDSRIMMVGTRGKEPTVQLWDLTLEDPEAAVRVLRGHEGSINEIALSRDSNLLVTVSSDNTVRLWDLTSENPDAAVRIFRLDQDFVRICAIGRECDWMVTATGVDNTALLWDLTAENPESTARVLRGHDGPVGLIGVSSDERWLVTGSGLDSVPRLWDLTADDPEATGIVLRGRFKLSAWMAISPDDRWLATRVFDGQTLTLDLWDLTAEDPAETVTALRGNEGHSMSFLAFSPDSHWLASIDDKETLGLWDLTAEDPGATADIVLYGIRYRGGNSVAFSPDGHWLAAVGDKETLGLWDLTAEDPGATADIVLHGIRYRGGNSVAFSPDGHWFAALGAHGIVRIWDVKADDPATAVRKLQGIKNASCVAFSPDSQRLFTGSTDGKAQLWDLTTEAPSDVATFLTGDGGSGPSVEKEAFSPDSHWLVTVVVVRGDNNRRTDIVVELWDLNADNLETTGRVLYTGLDSHRPPIIKFSPDCHWLITNGSEGDTQLWDLRRGKEPGATARVLPLQPATAAFSPDSRWLAMGGQIGMTRLWDLAESEPASAAVVLRAPEKRTVGEVVFTSDGGRLLTSSRGTVRIFEMNVDRLIERAQRQAGRELREHEKVEYHLPLKRDPRD